MAKPRTSTSYAVLGLLSVRPWTTYELAKQVQRSLNWFWPRAERKIYDEPKHLVDAGLATAAREATGQRLRTVYAITDEGRAELQRWLGEPPAPRTVEFEAMVKVFFSDAGTLQQLRATLSAAEAEASARIEALARMAGAPPPFPGRAHISALALRLQFEQEDAVRRWAEWAQEQVAEWATTTDPGSWDGAAVLAELGAPGTSGTASADR